MLAAKRSIVTVEEIVEVSARAQQCGHPARLDGGAIALVPGGAYPSYAHGYYKRDNAFYIAWDAIARDRDTFLAWMGENVLAKDPGLCRPCPEGAERWRSRYTPPRS